MPKYLNIACGRSFIAHADWENVDYNAADAHVRRQDILGNLVTSEASYEAVYCSHFVEHIPQELVDPFLRRCRQLTRQDGVFRVVVPDVEMLVGEYLRQRLAQDDAKAEYALVMLLDQCVRRKPGGRLAELSRRIASGELPALREYADYLNGRELPGATAGPAPKSLVARAAGLLARPGRLWQRLEPAYIRLVCSLLPPAFRAQNVSFCTVGERHMWMYDYASLGRKLRGAGFARVDRVAFDRSCRADGLFTELDARDGAPRKGHHQLFVEARP